MRYVSWHQVSKAGHETVMPLYTICTYFHKEKTCQTEFDSHTHSVLSTMRENASIYTLPTQVKWEKTK